MAAGGAFGHQEQLQQLRELRELEASNAALSLQVETLERRQMASRGAGLDPASGGPPPSAWGPNGVPGSRMNAGQRALSMNAALLGALSSQAQAQAALEQEQGAAGMPVGRGGRAPSPLGPGEDLMLVDGASAGLRTGLARGLLQGAGLQGGLGQGGDVVAPSSLTALGTSGAGGKALLGSGSGRPPSSCVPRRLMASPSLPAGTGKLGVPAGLPRPLPSHLQSLLAGAGGGGALGTGGAGSLSLAALAARLRPPQGGYPGMDPSSAAAAAAVAQSLERTSSAPPLGDLDLSALQSQLSDVSELERMYRALQEGAGGPAEAAPALQGLSLAHLHSPSYASSGASSIASSPERDSLRRLSSLGAQGAFPHVGPTLARPPQPGPLGMLKGGAHLGGQQAQQQQHQQGLLGRPSGVSLLRERTKLSRTSSCPPLSESELEAAMHAGQGSTPHPGGLGANSEANGLGGEPEDGTGKTSVRRKRARGGSAGGSVGLGAGAGAEVEGDDGFLGAFSGAATLEAPVPRPSGGRGKESKGSKGEGALMEPPSDVIHVRARRGQATDSHSLAERLRREKISERMKVLQDMVPTCAKVTGKAMMLDEIINYVRSLQLQVELLSAKLAALSQAQDEHGGAAREQEAQQQSPDLVPPGSGAGAGANAAAAVEEELRCRAEAGSATVDTLAGHSEAGGTEGESDAHGDSLGHPQVKQEPSLEQAYRHRSPDVSSSMHTGSMGQRLHSEAHDGLHLLQGPGDADTGDPSEHFNSELAGLLLRQHELEGSGGAGSGAPGAVPDMDDGDTDDILKLIADMGGGGAPFLESDWKLGQVKE